MRAALLLATSLLVSCAHVEVALPGVLDLRSDANAADVDKRAMTVEGREGMDAAFGGNGVKVAGPSVSVEGRVWWLASLIRIADGDVSNGVRVGVGKSGALRDVVITEEITAAEAIVFYCALPIPCAAAFLPTRTVTATGTRVLAPSAEGAP
jgi:hypothetical protein